MKWRIIVSILTILIGLSTYYVFEKYQGSIEGSIAVTQLEDTATSVALARAIAEDNPILGAIVAGCMVVLCLVWIPHIYKRFEKEEDKDEGWK
jgi:hypothetical protein